jgi:hypothetical protein
MGEEVEEVWAANSDQVLALVRHRVHQVLAVLEVAFHSCPDRQCQSNQWDRYQHSHRDSARLGP